MTNTDDRIIRIEKKVQFLGTLAINVVALGMGYAAAEAIKHYTGGYGWGSGLGFAAGMLVASFWLGSQFNAR